MCSNQNDIFMGKVLVDKFPERYNLFITQLKCSMGRTFAYFMKRTPLIMTLAMNDEFLMIKFLFDNFYTDATETTTDCQYNLTHICLIHNVSPKMFLLCHNHNMYNMYIHSLTKVQPYELLTNDYAARILAEKFWQKKHHILFLIGKKSDNLIITRTIQINELHRTIASFI